MQHTVTKKELVDRIADRTGLAKPLVREVSQAFLDQVIDELCRGNRMEFRDFGVFEVRTRKPRNAQNPKTLERVKVPSRKSVKFKPGRIMREAIDRGGRDEPDAGQGPPPEGPIPMPTREELGGAHGAKPAA